MRYLASKLKWQTGVIPSSSPDTALLFSSPDVYVWERETPLISFLFPFAPDVNVWAREKGRMDTSGRMPLLQ
jgi:hypothetical protein